MKFVHAATELFYGLDVLRRLGVGGDASRQFGRALNGGRNLFRHEAQIDHREDAEMRHVADVQRRDDLCSLFRHIRPQVAGRSPFQQGLTGFRAPPHQTYKPIPVYLSLNRQIPSMPEL